MSDRQEETPAQQQARMSASSATRELDELMASLSDFKVQSNVSMFYEWVEIEHFMTFSFGFVQLCRKNTVDQIYFC